MPLGARPEGRRGGLEPARLGPAHRQDPPRPAAAGDQPPARASRRRHRPAGRRRVPLSRSSTRSTRWRRRPARPCRRSRSTGCSQRPTVSNVIIGARNEEQLRQNLGAVGWNLTAGAGRQARRRQRRDRRPIPTGTSAVRSRSAIRRRCDRKRGALSLPFLLGGRATLRLEAWGGMVVRQVGSVRRRASSEALPVG